MYEILIEVHTRHGVYLKGRRLSAEELGVDAFVLISWGIAHQVASTISRAA